MTSGGDQVLQDCEGAQVTRVAVFDLDGTLVDTSGDMLGAANAILGAPILQVGRHSGLAFAGGRAMLREGARLLGRPLSEPDIDAAYPEFLQVYADNLSDRSVIYSGARDVVDALCRAGWRVAICTNKPEALADRLLQDLHWRDPFVALVGADTLASRKPDPAPILEAVARAGGVPDRAVMIGDSNGDLIAARAARMPVILVRFGVDPWAPITQASDGFCDNMKDLPPLLEGLLETGADLRAGPIPDPAQR